MSRVATGLTALSLLLLAACAVGPDYQRPAAPVAATFSEAPPAGFPGWHAAEPRDQLIRPDWWQLFGDSRLNELEARVDGNNQTLRQAEANFRAARAQVRFSRAAELPTVSVAPYAGLERLSANQPYFSRTAANTGENDFSLPLDVSYELDVWGRIRRGVTAAREQAQAAAADRETVRLALHAELAIDYFSLRSAIAQQKLLDDTVTAYAQSLDVTRNKYNAGNAALSDVDAAETQLHNAKAADIALGQQRAQSEHAIAILTGQPPADVTIDPGPWTLQPVAIPPGVPSTLLQRRPDVAEA